MKTVKEIRYLDLQEVRAEGGDAPKVTGYAALFNSRSQDLGGFVEQIAPGAFSKTLRESDVRMLYNHDASKPLARVSSGNLSLTQDVRGLKFEMTPDMSVSWIADAVNAIRAGLISQMSFGFSTINDSWDLQGDQMVRTLLEVQLYEISPVTFPAYTDTSVSARSYNSANEGDTIAYLEAVKYPAEKLDSIRKQIATRAKPAVTEPPAGTQADTNQENAGAIQEREQLRAQLERTVARGILIKMEKNHAYRAGKEAKT